MPSPVLPAPRRAASPPTSPRRRALPGAAGRGSLDPLQSHPRGFETPSSESHLAPGPPPPTPSLQAGASGPCCGAVGPGVRLGRGGSAREWTSLPARPGGPSPVPAPSRRRDVTPTRASGWSAVVEGRCNAKRSRVPSAVPALKAESGVGDCARGRASGTPARRCVRLRVGPGAWRRPASPAPPAVENPRPALFAGK